MLSLPFLDSPPRFLFFTGKGGVGKTSLACATAVRLAGQGKRVLLTSTDPASNVGQVFDATVGNVITPVPGVPRLDALEIDPQQAADAYRAAIIDPVRDLLPPAEVSAMTEQLSGACTTEIASFNEFTSLLADETATAAYDHVLFDTAPTGHTVRLLQLPGEWTTYLSDGKGDVSCLGPVAGLDRLRHDYAGALAALTDPTRTRLVLVTRPQGSSIREAARTFDELRELGMTNAHLVVNGVMPEYAVADAADDVLVEAVTRRENEALNIIPGDLAALPRTTIPLLAFNTVGVPALRALLDPDAPPAAALSGEIASLPDGLASLRDLVDDLESDGHGLVMCMGKGGVGKTTVAAAVALELAARGHEVLLTTTDPAAHLTETLQAQVEHLSVERIDPAQAITEYRERVMEGKGKALDDAGRAVLAEDLKSPCTDEVAVFQQFSHAVFRARKQFVVLDTAPTGHTLLLLDATGSYHREITRQMSEGARFITPLMRLQDPAQTKVLIVTLPETTPVLEAQELQDDLARAGITPWAWVVNASLTASAPTSSFLRARAHAEADPLARVHKLCERVAVLPLLAHEPVGTAALSELTRSATPSHLTPASTTASTTPDKKQGATHMSIQIDKPSVLFVCVHNAGRSQMAAAYLAHLSGGAVEVRSAGSEPADQVNPSAVAAMAEEGIDITAETPKILTTEAVKESDVVITMGCGDTCPIFPGKRYEDWDLADPAGKGVESVRPIRDEIKQRILGLLESLDVTPVSA